MGIYLRGRKYSLLKEALATSGRNPRFSTNPGLNHWYPPTSIEIYLFYLGRCWSLNGTLFCSTQADKTLILIKSKFYLPTKIGKTEWNKIKMKLLSRQTWIEHGRDMTSINFLLWSMSPFQRFILTGADESRKTPCNV